MCGGSSHLAGGVVGVLGQLGVHAIQADRVSDVAHGEAGLVQDGDDALVRLLHQVNNDLVVEVVDLDANGDQESNLRLTCRLVCIHVIRAALFTIIKRKHFQCQSWETATT